MRGLFAIAAVAILTTLAVACNGRKGNSQEDHSPGELPDTLRVGTLYSPTSYFIYREEKMGYDYDLMMSFGADKHNPSGTRTAER